MNIALITPYFPDKHTTDSGIANHYHLLAQNLAAAGNNVIVMHTRGLYDNEHESFSKHTIAQNITVITFKVKVPATISWLFRNKWAILDLIIKLRCMFITAQALKKVIKQYKIDIIETSSYFSLCYFTPYKKIKIPITVRVSTTFSQMMKEHYPFKSKGMDLIAAMEIAFIKRSKHLITHAYNHAKELEQLYNISASRFSIIPHGVNLPNSYVENYDGGSTIKVLYTGRFEYRKGTDVLLAAILLVLQKNSNIVFELIGNDPDNQYKTWFKQNNEDLTSHKVVFSGRVTANVLADAYRSCDIFVAPSRYESFGIVFIEAMSYGKPVIGCKVGGVPDIITDKYNGLLADAGDALSLADRILFLATNEVLRRQMGLNARKTIEYKFTGKKLAASSFHYYQTLLKS